MNLRFRHQTALAFLLLLGTTLYASGPEEAERDRILVIRPDSEEFTIPYQAMVDNLIPEWDRQLEVVPFRLRKRPRLKNLVDVYTKSQPKAIVLMDVAAINLYSELQKSRRDESFPPAIIMMASFASEQVKRIRNATALDYEVQAVTALTNMRHLFNGTIQKVGVLYSTNLRDFWERQVSDAENEQFHLEGILIDEKKRSVERQIRKGLEELIEKEEVDAIWILNDNPLLNNRDLFEWGWKPGLRDFDGPVVVSVESMIGRGQIGQFAIVPNHATLGIKVANMLLELEENDWLIEDPDPEVLPSYDHKYNANKITEEMSKKLDRGVLDDEWLPIDSGGAL